MLSIDVSMIPLDRRVFAFNTSVKNLETTPWGDYHVVPIQFSLDNKLLDAGYLCTILSETDNLLLPVGRFYSYEGILGLTPWHDETVAIETLSLLNAIRQLIQDNPKYNQLEGLELIDGLAVDYFLTPVEKAKYLLATTQEAVIYTMLALTKSKGGTQKVVSLPEEIQGYLAADLERLSDESTSLEDRRHITNYLGLLQKIPWGKVAIPQIDKEKVRAQLDTTHYGISTVKENLVDFINLYTQDGRFPMAICLLGSPSGGKTSLVRSLAVATGMKAIPIPLSGINEASTLVGFNKAYKNSSPGKIINGLIQSKTMNPVFIFDEIDKAGPAVHSALLHILDPDHNDIFVDEYIGFPVNLSNCLFFCTANLIHGLPEALRRRLLVIELPKYTQKEKEEMIRDFIFPSCCRKVGIKGMTVSDNLVRQLSQETEPGKIETKLYTLIARAHNDGISLVDSRTSSKRESNLTIGFCR